MRWLCLLILIVAGCGERPPPVNAPEGPRVVSLSPAASIMLRDAGLELSIVGRHGWDAVLDQSLPVAGDQTGLDYERLIGLNPTHVVIEWGERELPERLVSLASARGFELVSIDTLTLEDIAASDQAIRSSLGIERRNPAQPLFDAPREPREGWGTVMLVVAASPNVDCLGPGSAHHELLVRAGFSAAIADGAPWVTMSLEDAIRINPSCIVLVQPGGPGDTIALPDRLGPLADTSITAVTLGRVVLIDEPTALIPSTNLAAFAQQLREKLDGLGPLPSPP